MPSASDPAPVTRADLDDLALALPEVSLGTSWNHPAYVVGGKAFVRFREPRKDCLDPATGEPMDDVIVINVPGPDDKSALVEAGPWFTIPHFDGYDAVLVRERDLAQVDYAELVEVITDAWATRAPKKLVKQHLG